MKKQNYDEQMKSLQDHIGSEVIIEYISYGKKAFERQKLTSVDPFQNIGTKCSGIPFIGYGTAIQKIMDAKGQVLYSNNIIFDNYDVRNEKKRYKIARKCFGDNAGKRIVNKKPPIVKTSQLKDLLNEDKITKQQYEWVKGHENNWMGRGYALNIVNAANELYDMIRDVNDGLENILNDVIELSNNTYVHSLTKPIEEYSQVAKQVKAKLDGQNHSGNSYAFTVAKFLEVTAERKNLELKLKTGIVNGAIWHIEK